MSLRPASYPDRHVRVSIAIQTHPKRSELADGLLAYLLAQGGDAELASDPEPLGIPSPWRTYRHALDTTPSWATHRLIVQDDTLPCDDFVPAARLALTARPDRLVSFFVAGEPSECAHAVLQAGASGQHWARLSTHRWVPCIALAWPVALIPLALAWIDEQQYPETFRGDDEIVGRAATALPRPAPRRRRVPHRPPRLERERPRPRRRLPHPRHVRPPHHRLVARPPLKVRRHGP